MILNSKLDISIHIRSYICRNFHYIAPNFLEGHRTERRRKEEGMSLIGGLKAFQADMIMDRKIHKPMKKNILQ